MKEGKEIVLMRVPTKLRRHSTSMKIEATLSSLTSTYPLTTHKHIRTLRTSHMGEEHSKVKDLDRICNNIISHLGSNNKNKKSGAEEI